MKVWTLWSWVLLSIISSQVGISAAVAQEDILEKWRQNSVYTDLMKYCIPHHPLLSELSLQTEIDIDSAFSVRQGFLSALGLASTLQIDPGIQKKQESNSYYLALSDCFGTDQEGELLEKAFLLEIALDEAFSQSASWGATNLAGAKAIGLLMDGLIPMLKLGSTQIGLLAELAEKNPTLFPQLKKWGITSSVLAQSMYFARNSYIRAKKTAQDKVQQEEAQSSSVVYATESIKYQEEAEAIEKETDLLNEFHHRMESCTSQCDRLHIALVRYETGITAQVPQIDSMIRSCQTGAACDELHAKLIALEEALR
jgi:hypothetical protein